MEQEFVYPTPDWCKDFAVAHCLAVFLHEVVNTCALLVFLRQFVQEVVKILVSNGPRNQNQG